MKNCVNLVHFWVLIGVLFLTNCSSPPPKETWHESMQELSRLMSELMPSIVSQKYEFGGREQTQIRNLTNRLSGLSHSINKSTQIPSQDSSLRFAAREFKSEVQVIQQLMDQNRWQEVKPHLNRVSQYCIACHTQTQGGSSGYSLNLKPNLQGLTEFDKATYFTSVRQFEQAIMHFENALTDAKWAKDNPELWNRGVVQLLAIITRVKRNPNLLLEMLSRFFDTDAYPQDLKAHARIWREHAKRWDQEKMSVINISVVEFRMRTAQNKFKGNMDALILFLRSSADLNELLRSGSLNVSDEQAAYSFSGQIVEALPELNYLGFANDYYQICAELAPKTKIGKFCQKKIKN